MVVLNNSLPIDYNYLKKNISTKLNDSVLNILENIFYKNEEKDKKNINYILKNIKIDLKNMLDENRFIDKNINYNYCNHIYKRGKHEGYMCCKKIFIKPNSDEQKYKCSRHCRNYNTKSRSYSKYNPRCSYIRKNNERCKHRCYKDNIYCYIHENKYNIEHNINNKNKMIIKLKTSSFKNKHKYNKQKMYNLKYYFEFFKNRNKVIKLNNMYNKIIEHNYSHDYILNTGIT